MITIVKGEFRKLEGSVTDVALEAGGMLVSDEIKISAEVQFVAPA
jgi:hypothetical protein